MEMSVDAWGIYWRIERPDKRVRFPPSPVMEYKMRTISREELELEKIETISYSNIYCQYSMKCTRAGGYMRCGTHLSCLCPFYASYYQQEELRKKDFDAEG